MIQKIKELMNIKELIDKISSRIEKQNKFLSALANEQKNTRKEFSALKEDIIEIKKRQEKSVEEFERMIEKLAKSGEMLDSEIQDFKLLKGQMTKKVIDNIKDELESSFMTSIDRLKTDVKQYNDLKNNLATIESSLAELRMEIDKFNNISKRIKEEDFELTKFARKLTEQDKEKLALMKQIDSLQRLIARQRRQQHY